MLVTNKQIVQLCHINTVNMFYNNRNSRGVNRKIVTIVTVVSSKYCTVNKIPIYIRSIQARLLISNCQLSYDCMFSKHHARSRYIVGRTFLIVSN